MAGSEIGALPGVAAARMGRWPTRWPLRLGRPSEGGLKFFEAGSQDRAAMEIFEIPFAADGVDPLAQGVGHLAEPGVEDVENCLASVLDDAFFEAFFKSEFFEEGDVGHDLVG